MSNLIKYNTSPMSAISIAITYLAIMGNEIPKETADSLFPSGMNPVLSSVWSGKLHSKAVKPQNNEDTWDPVGVAIGLVTTCAWIMCT